MICIFSISAAAAHRPFTAGEAIGIRMAGASRRERESFAQPFVFQRAFGEPNIEPVDALAAQIPSTSA